MIQNKESSETTREILLTQFNFENYLQFGTPQHKPNPDKQFLEWFIGFFEAEGCFLKWPNNQGKDMRFGIEISQKDPKLMYKIRTNLGFGRVMEYSKVNNKSYWRFYIHDFKNLTRLIWLFQNNLVTNKKTNAFKNWINEINKTKNTNFSINQSQRQVSLKTAWLSGFLEGDGGFWVSSNFLSITKENKKTYQLKMKFYLTQNILEFDLLQTILNLLPNNQSKVQLIKNSNGLEYYRIETYRLENHLFISNYLKKYPFLGRRNITLSRWQRLLNYRIYDYPITIKSIKKLKRLIQSTKNIDLNSN